MGRFGNLRERTIDDDEVKRGWVPPGYDYMGPGNDVHIGAARNAADQVSKEHDIEYGHEEEVGVNPKTNWVDADDEFLRQLQPEGFMERAAQFIFSAKKAAKSVGVLGDMSGKKRKSKAIRASPWEEGEDFRTARLNRQRNRNTWLNTRGHHTTGIRQSIANEQDWANMPELVDDEEEENDDAMNVEDEDNWNANDTTIQQQASLVNLPEDEEADEWWNGSSGQEAIAMAEAAASDDPMGEQVSARSSAGGGPNPVSKETPISRYPTLTYGLQETHTTILPWTGWASVPFTTTGVPTILELRMNTPYDFFITGVTQVAANITPAPITQGVYNKPIQPDGTILTAVAFPQGINNGTAVEQPAWRQYWGQLYEYYTVLGCEYKITIVNPVTTYGASGIIGQSYESYSTTAGATGNTTPTSNLYDMMALKGMRFTVVDENGGTPLQNRTVIQGRYKPGQAHRNIVNDGDVKTWTKTDFDNVAAGLPTLTEILRLYFWRGALATTNVGGCNMQIELKYIVQFKDLRANAKWPVSSGAGANIVTNLTPVNTAIGTALQRWT